MNNKIIIAVIVIALLVLAYKFFIGGPATTAVDVEPAKFEELTNGKDAVILDVRSGFEFKGDKIAGAENISYTSGGFKSNIEKLDKDKTYLVYCASGSRSAGAVNSMMGMGFEKVYNLQGGIDNWKSAGKPVVR